MSWQNKAVCFGVVEISWHVGVVILPFINSGGLIVQWVAPALNDMILS